jgi:hypothetical protein
MYKVTLDKSSFNCESNTTNSGDGEVLSPYSMNGNFNRDFKQQTTHRQGCMYPRLTLPMANDESYKA